MLEKRDEIIARNSKKERVSCQAVKTSLSIAEFQLFLVLAGRSLHAYSGRVFERKDFVVWSQVAHTNCVTVGYFEFN